MYGNSLPNYDRWLTTDRAAERAEAEHDAFEAWCETEGVDMYADGAWDAFQEAMEALSEDWAIAAAEAAAERRADDMAERMMDAAYDMEY